MSRIKTINPYLSASEIIVLRLLWDLRPISWRSRRTLKRLKDKHKGERAVILCNGPSLLKSDLDALEGVFSFGLNKINLLFDSSGFRPSCIVAVNSLVIEQNADFYNTTDIPLFLDSAGTKWVQPRDEVTYLHSVNYPRFARDCSVSIWQGATVTYVALQLAFHMGFTKVALIGADHNFVTKGQAHKEVMSEDRDLNHFDSKYFAEGMKWQLPDLPQSELAYSIARDTYEGANRVVVNATVGGKLEVFPRMSLKKYLTEK